MKYAQLGTRGSEIPVVMHDGKVYDLRSITDQIDGVFLQGGIETVADLLAADELPLLHGADSLRVGSPIARPSAIICIGMNYAAHAAEAGSAPPEHMVIFNKHPNTLSGPNDDVVIPPGSVKTDWEVELGLVVGKPASRLASPEVSLDHIAGFVTVNDLSERAWQLELSGAQWGKGKSAPGFAPVGPWLVTTDCIDASNLRLRSWVNGEPRQDSKTSDMIFDPSHIVWELSQYMNLEPGDLILTGTPEGVALSGKFAFIQDGDVVEIEVEGLGKQKQMYVPFTTKGVEYAV
ncbi:FAA hydrolase family protein [Cryobacterium frigoriphilum]|uniref:FAA hydrolase family protein n=1 Tax=Cryobacterium frigoriphilum TaxID=1259150 RepID=A0A4R8ZUR5_9MICO|nr:fumarylacetoacetate hydrolase family protein [Cryobacterium frigoriphilum]TFD46907.1 FAA hydrolase family protein [Cryobacterium frigoriphilum]